MVTERHLGTLFRNGMSKPMRKKWDPIQINKSLQILAKTANILQILVEKGNNREILVRGDLFKNMYFKRYQNIILCVRIRTIFHEMYIEKY